MARIMCYRCFWPRALCWCQKLHAMETRTRFMFLMHPKEYKQEKAGTGRLTQLCLPHSSLHMGKTFDQNDEVQALLCDRRYYPVLLYPGREALNLSEIGKRDSGEAARFRTFSQELGQRTLLVVILDATWSGARKMLRLSPSLQVLTRIMFTPQSPSRYVIKQQPQDGCLSTLEATHELLTVLERAGLDRYAEPALLLGIFQQMQDFQIGCASDPARVGYRHRSYTKRVDRLPARGRSATRRENFLKRPPTDPMGTKLLTP
jgi:DTW domain-containing protein